MDKTKKSDRMWTLEEFRREMRMSSLPKKRKNIQSVEVVEEVYCDRYIKAHEFNRFYMGIGEN